MHVCSDLPSPSCPSLPENDALNQSTYTGYDLRGNVVRQYGATYPVWYEYDAEGRVVAMATTRDTALDPATVGSLDHPSLDVTQWNYDPATGLLVQKLYDDGKGPSYTYTPDGKLATRTWARGVVTEYGYDVAGELASVQYSDGTPPILKTYNRLGNPVMIVSAGTTNIFEYSATTLERISDTQLGYAIRYGNDNLGRMESLSITNHYDGAYAYDAFGRMAKASFEGLDFHYAYLPGSDLVNALTYGAVKKTVAFEARRNLVTGIAYHTIADTLIAERTYTYNALGNVVARTRQRGADPVETDDFDHNLRSELIAASLGGTNAVSGDYGYAYDPIGNRVVATNRSDVTAYASNELNQYTNIVSEVEFTPAFDDDGNQTLVKTSTGIWHVTYNAENRPVVWSNATAVIAMGYDYMGRRISKRLLAGGGETVNRQFLYDGHLQIAAIETNALVSTTFWDPTEPIATRPLAMKDGSFIDTYTHDLTKNVIEVLDPGGDPVVVYDYGAFGTMSASRPYINPFRFSSEYYNADLGCVYYNYRHYNPLDGRWLTRDPIEETKEHNCYSFCNNIPSSYFDKLGNSATSQQGEEKEASGTGCSIGPCLNFCSKMMLVSSRLACERNRRGAKEKFEKWFKENSDLDWTKKLLDCPCNIGEDKKSGDSSGITGWGALTDKLHGYHVGASLCMRSTPVDGHANQCCYDKCGKLITHGSGAGSAGYVPGTVWTYFGHNATDMQPADWAKILDGGTWGCWSDAYLLRRPQKGSEKCDRNP